MAKKFLTDINLNKNELQNAIIQNLASDPSNPVAGQVYFNTTTNRFRVYTGTEWDEMGTGGGTVTSVAASNTDGSLSISGSPITNSGTITIEHSNTITEQTTQGLYPIAYDANGHITSAGTAININDYAPLASPALIGTPTAPTATKGTDTTQVATTAFVQDAIADLEGSMHYKGTVSGGTLPLTDVVNGDTYKVAEAGTYGGQAAKVGDLFIAVVEGSTIEWTYVPSADDTAVTSITAGTGLTGGTITTTGTIAIADTLASAVTTSGVYPIKVNAQGQITEVGSAVTILQKYTSTIEGDSTHNEFTITHNIGTKDITVQVYDASTNEDVIVDIERTSINAVKISFASAPTTGTDYNVVIVG